MNIQIYDACPLAKSSKRLKKLYELREGIRMKVRLLDKYYTSGEWQEDNEADEEGLLPADLKRGVLSQDELYDFLMEWQAEDGK